jgi:hypothetical protein
VAHHDFDGCPAALHVAEIHAWIVAALDELGVKKGPRFVMSSLYVIAPVALTLVAVKAFETNTFPWT